ncbi:MAG TPA: isoaspartyl peptidase/L-asparaginase family protein [Polyangia bacterium]|nr:isoaspartyl peptidase/L-asparaginase family protein [Polyangia bacterium]
MPASLIVHGGAGDWSSEDGEGEALVAACGAAAGAGFEILRRGGSALDAATAAVVVLEDDPRFNAGTGSALTADGEVECDASVMCGDGRAGAVGALRDVKNPIQLARLVMEKTPHVLLVGAGAATFAAACGLAPLPPGALITERMRDKWRAARERAAGAPSNGTVGCVARDTAGRVAAATSTGGMMLKRGGRVGDSAVIGAGTYADDGAGAVSCTGLGEAFMKAAAAKQAVELLRAGRSPAEAARELLPAVRRHGGSGGLICVDAAGRLGLAFDTPRMAHAWIDSDGREGGGFRGT